MPGYDLSLIQYTDAQGFQFLLGLPYRSGARITGGQKTIQRFIMELMTQAGSVLFQPDYGCNLVSEIRGCNVQSLDEINECLTQSIHTVVMNMRTRDRADATAEEIVDTVNVLELIQNFDHVLARLQLITFAGTQHSLELPLEL